MDTPRSLYRARQIRRAYQETGDIFACYEWIVQNCVKDPPPLKELKITRADAEFMLRGYIAQILELEQYQSAAIIIWGPEIFNPEPHPVKLVWDAMARHTRNLFMGAGSVGKSFNGGVRFALDFVRDPEWTTIKVISSTAGHAKTNIFAHMKGLLTSGLFETMIPIPGLKVTTTSIMVGENEKFGIHLSSIPAGDNGKGRLRGCHPVPRPKIHPKFGWLSRVMIALDEAEEIPVGVWEELNNILLTEESDGKNVVVFAATNPKDRGSRFALEAEPKEGWASLDIDRDETWTSARGWNVVRLDGARCENVIEKRVIYPGLQTWEGFERLLKLGTDNPEYYTMARGWFPESSAQAVIITESMFASAKGIYVFAGAAIPWAGLDLAFEGNDAVVLTFGRCGLAAGWNDAQHKYHEFEVPMKVAQVETQILLEKQPTIEQTQAVMRICRQLGVTPPWLTGDRTGNGTGVMDALANMFGVGVMGIHFGESATDTKILQDDKETCQELYADIITEMAFALRRFIETNLVKFAPGINWTKLERQCTTRRYKQVGKKMVRLESKKDYKKRNAESSPDEFDSLILGINGVRRNEGMTTVMVRHPAKKNVVSGLQNHGIVDVVEFVDMSE